MKKDKLWVILAMVLFFVAGVFSGIFTDRMFLRSHAVDFKSDKRHDWKKDQRGNHEDRFVGMLEKELGLSAEQKENIRKILKDGEPALIEFRDDMRDKLKIMHDEMNTKIMEQLDEGQKAGFIELERKNAERFERLFKKPSGGPEEFRPEPGLEPGMEPEPGPGRPGPERGMDGRGEKPRR